MAGSTRAVNTILPSETLPSRRMDSNGDSSSSLRWSSGAGHLFLNPGFLAGTSWSPVRGKEQQGPSNVRPGPLVPNRTHGSHTHRPPRHGGDIGPAITGRTAHAGTARDAAG